MDLKMVSSHVLRRGSRVNGVDTNWLLSLCEVNPVGWVLVSTVVELLNSFNI